MNAITAQQRFLLVRLDHVGDCVMTVPAVAKAIKESEAGCVVELLTTGRNAKLLRADPHLDRTIVYDAPWSVRPPNQDRTPRIEYVKKLLQLLGMALKPREIGRYDAVFYLSYSPYERLLTTSLSRRRIGFDGPYEGVLHRLGSRSLSHAIPFDESRHVLENDYDLVEEVIPLKTRAFDSRLRLSLVDKEEGLDLLEAAGIVEESLLAIHPGGGAFRSWAPDRYGHLAAKAARAWGCDVAVMTGPTEYRLGVEVVAKASHPRVKPLITPDYHAFCRVVSHARGFVGNDTGPTHIAAACGVPTVAIFGPTSPTIFAPPGQHVRVVTCPRECAPCHLPWRIKPGCETDHVCLEEVTVEQVWKALDAVLAKKKQERG